MCEGKNMNFADSQPFPHIAAVDAPVTLPAAGAELPYNDPSYANGYLPCKGYTQVAFRVAYFPAAANGSPGFQFEWDRGATYTTGADVLITRTPLADKNITTTIGSTVGVQQVYVQQFTEVANTLTGMSERTFLIMANVPVGAQICRLVVQEVGATTSPGGIVATGAVGCRDSS
jgi:hypothetical protein